EDTQLTLDMLRAQGFSETVVEAVDSVTRRKGESYMEFVKRAAQNPIGRAVKIADLKHNMDISRISNPTEKDYARLEKYKMALQYLQEGEE
ncbi:MAG: GTP pyrophosphokinase, partial [Solobacterium sp.]|nr:GTP pyrophosphokinase [Solobacterium sp.]